MTDSGLNIALIVPCFNEELAIAQVIRSFKTVLPELLIYVFDNNSTDRTASIARAEGAEVISVTLPGKGNVVRRMFADVDADIYVMVDGDATYDAPSIVPMINKLINEQLDMVVGCRHTVGSELSAAYRPGHTVGNKLLTGSVSRIFGGTFTDMLSGYRVFTRRYVKSFPALSEGFEIETELTVHALELRMPYGEVVTPYGARPPGSYSKLSTYRDGIQILLTIFRLFIAERPLSFFGAIAGILSIGAVILATPVVLEFLNSGTVPRFPTAFLAASMVVCALTSAACGLILNSITRGRQELKRLFYLSLPSKKLAHQNPS